MTVSLVTGAGSGIGAASAAALAARGDRVVCVDVDLAAAERTAGRIGGALAVQADVADAAACDAAVAAAAARAMLAAGHGGKLVLVGSVNSAAARRAGHAGADRRGGRVPRLRRGELHDRRVRARRRRLARERLTRGSYAPDTATRRTPAARRAERSKCNAAAGRSTEPGFRPPITGLGMADLNGADELACQEVVELLGDYLEGVMPAAERARLEEHLAACEGCADYLEQLRTAIRLTGRLGGPSVPPETLAALLDAFRAWRAT
jgi:Putative zinc-finger/short chain dehydrogenase